MVRCIPVLLPLMLLPSLGCSPASVAMKVGMFAVGTVMDDAETDELRETLIGRPPSAADAQLGPRNDTFEQVDGPVTWISYPVKLDPLKRNQYFVEVQRDRIVRIEKMKGTTSELDLARSTLKKAQVQGKSPRECEDILDAGPPKLTVRSRHTGQLLQFYDGALLADVGPRKYILLRFDRDLKCEKLQLVEVGVDTASPS